MADYLAGFYPEWVDKEENPRQIILDLGKMITNRIPVKLGFQKLNQPGQGGGFAASGRRHQVQKIDSLLLQFFPKFLCLGIVVCEYTLLNFQNSYLFQKHRSFLVIPA